MSRLLNTIRGSYTVVNAKRSTVRVIGADVPTGNGILVVHFNVNDVEKSSTIQCFGGKNHIYAFGHDPDQSTFSVTYLVFLGARCSRGTFVPGMNLSLLNRRYMNAKVSTRKAVVRMACGGGVSYTGILLGLSVSMYDPELNVVSATLSGKIVR